MSRTLCSIRQHRNILEPVQLLQLQDAALPSTAIDGGPSSKPASMLLDEGMKAEAARLEEQHQEDAAAGASVPHTEPLAHQVTTHFSLQRPSVCFIRCRKRSLWMSPAESSNRACQLSVFICRQGSSGL